MHRLPARAFVCLLLLCSASLAAETKKKSASSKTITQQITAILSQPQLARAHWGIDVIDEESGKEIYSLNSDQLFLPASNMKLITTAAALALAGPDYRFHTTIETTGKLDDAGRLQGDLVIVGRGDPNISGRVMPYQLKTERIAPHTQVLEEMADQLAKKGVKIVDGDIVGDDTFYASERYGESWGQDDLQWIDGAPVSALSFNDNVIFLNIQPGEHAGDKALLTQETETNYYEFDNRIVTAAPGVARKIGIHRDPGARKVVLWGVIPVGDKGLKEALAIEDPAEYTAHLFQEILGRRGITVNGKARARHGDIAQFFDQPPAPPLPSDLVNPAPELTAPVVLAEHISLPMLEDVRVTNKTSQNLHAEMALRLVGKLGGMTPSFEGGTAVLKQFLLKAGAKEEELSFHDGSGLSRLDLVTPSAMLQLLLYASHQPWGAAYRESLPVGGVDGSLSERFLNTPAGGLIHAKTGTLTHVNALSGYGETKAGKHFVFSIFCNSHNLPGGKVLAAIDSIIQVLVKN
jgi:serine-type D-Ala-D-Ala carboxypeptidase/endopeptidase (penicillin-binding protein 4)